MKNLIVFTALNTIYSAVIAVEINLICDVKSTYTYSSGTVEKGFGNALLEVSDKRSFKSIFITSDDEVANNLSVLSRQDGSTQSIDNSTSAKWDIENSAKRVDGSSRTRIVIDRTTGILIANRDFETNGRVNRSNVSGVCRKNDASTKKF